MWPRFFYHGCWDAESQQVQADTRQVKTRIKEDVFLYKDSQAVAEIAVQSPLLEVLKTCLERSICISSIVF